MTNSEQARSKLARAKSGALQKLAGQAVGALRPELEAAQAEVAALRIELAATRAELRSEIELLWAELESRGASADASAE